MAMRYAKKKGGSKAKRKGGPNKGHPVAQWRKANSLQAARAGLQGEFKNGTPRRYATDRTSDPDTAQHRGHVHLPSCDCLARADWKDNYSEEYIAQVKAAKALDKRRQAHERNGAVCSRHSILLSLNGKCPECE